MPNRNVLQLPPENTSLYKVISLENLTKSIKDQYLFFTRVDQYNDFPDSDEHDGEQTLNDREAHKNRNLQNSDFTMEKFYDQNRKRTYACCFSLENSPHIWENYGGDDPKQKICLIFCLSKLKEYLNSQLARTTIYIDTIEYHQIFNINYGVVSYVNWNNHTERRKYEPNPIQYTYIKDEKFSNEKEFRITLSTIALGNFQGFKFPSSIGLEFDFHKAINSGVIRQFIVNEGFSETNIKTFSDVGVNFARNSSTLNSSP